ncbi:hypothetical protein V1477_018976 [Vespula maculifrons]|uniref:Uncharacterized protein n=1 Tax=Vespula maculifrons TaxID=7453 RepID=A0ABD2AT03_VESMC
MTGTSKSIGTHCQEARSLPEKFAFRVVVVDRLDVESNEAAKSMRTFDGGHGIIPESEALHNGTRKVNDKRFDANAGTCTRHDRLVKPLSVRDYILWISEVSEKLEANDEVELEWMKLQYSDIVGE